MLDRLRLSFFGLWLHEFWDGARGASAPPREYSLMGDHHPCLFVCIRGSQTEVGRNAGRCSQTILVW
jgi:hypothetical protein